MFLQLHSERWRSRGGATVLVEYVAASILGVGLVRDAAAVFKRACTSEPNQRPTKLKHTTTA